MNVINLRERFGKLYRISHDEAAESRNDPWTYTLSCERGTIYPHGGDLLAVEVDGRPITAKKVAALPGVVLHQDGDHEKTFLFHVDLFEQVAELVKPRKRRHLTDEQRAAAAVRLAEHQFKPHASNVVDAQNASGQVW